MRVSARTSMRLKRIRRRFGIGAPQVTIRSQIPWYGRWAIGLLAIGIVLLVIGLGFGLRIDGGRDAVAADELRSLRSHVMELDAELTRLRGIAGAGESSIQLERATLRKLSQQVQLLESENALLKEDLAFFEGILPSSGGGESGIRIDRFRVERGMKSGEYRYKMLVINGAAAQAKEFRGSLELLVRVKQGGRESEIRFPSEERPESLKYQVEVNGFHRIDGVFEIPQGMDVLSAEARLLQGSAVRARQSTML